MAPSDKTAFFHENDDNSTKINAKLLPLFQCLKVANFFLDNPDHLADSGQMKMTEDESYIIQLLFHFQTGIQYNLHGIYQVGTSLIDGSLGSMLRSNINGCANMWLQ